MNIGSKRALCRGPFWEEELKNTAWIFVKKQVINRAGGRRADCPGRQICLAYFPAWNRTGRQYNKEDVEKGYRLQTEN